MFKKFFLTFVTSFSIFFLFFMYNSIIVNADNGNIVDSNGNNIISGKSYSILISWGSTTSKDVYLTGDEFKSSNGKGSLFQITNIDGSMGNTIPENGLFNIRNDSTGQVWNWKSNFTTVSVQLADSIIKDVTEVGYMQSSSFAVGDPGIKSNGVHNYELIAGGAYGLGYDWNNTIGLVNNAETEFAFVP
ncbi:hypothetical protein [Enterococcus faecalis]|uniref:hypothetical protein n=1 Tax=Enterococcus faecalis TaxID=1351 RepID=UPI0018E110EC|nr:hypothetical protein [Enterococcus faecalis]MBI0605129.1 hypothetical protein [Enterococcus faecalis]